MMDMEQSSGELMERLKRLEHKQADLQRTNRRLGSVTGMLLLVSGAMALMGQTGTKQPQSLEAEQFVLRGNDGKVRGAMGITSDGAVGLNLADVKGQTRITLDVAADCTMPTANCAPVLMCPRPIRPAWRFTNEAANRPGELRSDPWAFI
jgi:hypothetical protein